MPRRLHLHVPAERKLQPELLRKGALEPRVRPAGHIPLYFIRAVLEPDDDLCPL